MDSSLGFALTGLGTVIVCLMLAWFFYHVTRFYKTYADKEERYSCLEIGLIRKIAKKLDIDLEYERLKTEMFKPVKSIRKEIEQKILNEMVEVMVDDKDKQSKLKDFKDKEN